MTTPTLTMFVEGRLCVAGPCRGRGAVLREFPAPPPRGGASLPWGGPAGGSTPTLTMFAEGRLCVAGPCRGRGAVLREFPAPPPRGGASLPWGGPAEGSR